MGNCSVIVSLFLLIQTDCLFPQGNSELMPALSGSQKGMSIAIAQEVFWASPVVFSVHVASLIFMGVYHAYIAICTFRIKTYFQSFWKVMLLQDSSPGIFLVA